MKILFVIRSTGTGGADKQLAMTANALSDKGHEVSVYTYNWDTIHSDLRNVKYIPSKIRGKIGEYLFSVPEIRKVVKQEKADIVISWRANAGCFARLATIGLKCKLIYSERTDPYLESGTILDIAKWVCNFSDGGVFQTVEARKYYKKLYSKSIVIPNPFKSSEFHEIIPIEDRRKEISFVARFFIVQKRQDIMLKAFEEVYKQTQDFTLVFYGEGVDMEKVKSMVKGKPYSKNVIFKGNTKNITNEIRGSRILALTSDYEGIPNVLIEAHEAGVPVVATDCSPGGARVVVQDGKDGFIVPRGDYKAVADKIMTLIKDDDLSTNFIKNGGEAVKKFDPKQIFEEWEKYILSVNRL